MKRVYKPRSFDILRQPDETTCGPTCLHAIYQYHKDNISLTQVIREVPHLEGGGTLGVHLACHALKRGYHATVYTYNLHVFDPSWFKGKVDFHQKLEAQMAYKSNPKLHIASKAYQEFFKLGGILKFEELTPRLIRTYLHRSVPILTGLSSTYLYQDRRELVNSQGDDIRGEPVGHFVVLAEYFKDTRGILVADPYIPNPVANSHKYTVSIDRVIGAILLGIVTYDANLLIIEPA